MIRAALASGGAAAAARARGRASAFPVLGFVVQKRQRPEKGRGQEFPAALFAIEIHIKQIAGVKLRLVP